jgi:hypothetical protein
MRNSGLDGKRYMLWKHCKKDHDLRKRKIQVGPWSLLNLQLPRHLLKEEQSTIAPRSRKAKSIVRAFAVNEHVCCQQLETYGSCNNSKISTIAKYYASKDEKKRTPRDRLPYLEDNAWPSCCASPIFKMLKFPPRRPLVRAQIFIPLQNTCRRRLLLRHRQMPPRYVPISDGFGFELASLLPSM